MTSNQKEEFIKEIKRIEEIIDTLKATTKHEVDNAENWCGAETAATYSSRLNAYIAERRGLLKALTILGCEITWARGTNKLDEIYWGEN